MKIASCPYCGGRPILGAGYDKMLNLYYDDVHCMDCGASGEKVYNNLDDDNWNEIMHRKYTHQAIRLWNQRHHDIEWYDHEDD